MKARWITFPGRCQNGASRNRTFTAPEFRRYFVPIGSRMVALFENGFTGAEAVVFLPNGEKKPLKSGNAEFQIKGTSIN